MHGMHGMGGMGMNPMMGGMGGMGGMNPMMMGGMGGMHGMHGMHGMMNPMMGGMHGHHGMGMNPMMGGMHGMHGMHSMHGMHGMNPMMGGMGMNPMMGGMHGMHGADMNPMMSGMNGMMNPDMGSNGSPDITIQGTESEDSEESHKTKKKKKHHRRRKEHRRRLAQTNKEKNEKAETPAMNMAIQKCVNLAVNNHHNHDVFAQTCLTYDMGDKSVSLEFMSTTQTPKKIASAAHLRSPRYVETRRWDIDASPHVHEHDETMSVIVKVDDNEMYCNHELLAFLNKDICYAQDASTIWTKNQRDQLQDSQQQPYVTYNLLHSNDW
eukprot:CAMPEP_0202700498 /NCGR_PEP_ID=MMETSP1385-20130828/13669_1 /ASSEMBLY_ACC=CAM_ASM_000861 /TAXON_ID=933848 /ORGANISM="Elphidium margaritaceum" /LENGTH=322 /DNA_ID=CAMNT_0049357695 /DNA_START=1 /DNA_END=966 /DNA_ORIENTATION=+